MKIVCAWCDNVIREDSVKKGKGVSHGICDSCREYFFKDTESSTFDKFLDKLSVPVIVVDEDVKIVTANNKAKRLLGKRQKDFKGIYFGDAVECDSLRHITNHFQRVYLS